MKLMQKTVWAITPEMLSTMVSIAHQTNKSPEAIAKEMGRDMKNTYAVSTRGGVAVIPVTGPLFRHANLLTAVCGATSYELLAQDFNKALNDPKISAILFDVDSPGGEVNGCSELAEMIYKARGKKPIIAYASGSCCSGAYWIASACDKIMAADTAILGSIGVVSIFEKEDEKKTIEIVSSQSPNKRPDVETEEGKAKIQAHIDALAEVFINKVALHRDISPKNVIENFGGGDVFVGQNAVRIGLADSLASFEAIISDLNTQSTEKSFMNDTLEKTSVDIKAQERERMSQVLSAENVKGKEATAQALLAKTDLSESDILAILETVPVAFKNTIINEYSVILQDVDAVKNYLYEKVGTEPYLWLGIPEVKKKIQQLAEAQYNKNGYEKALAKIDKMDTEDVKSYIKKLIKDDMILGIQIIKNSH